MLSIIAVGGGAALALVTGYVGWGFRFGGLIVLVGLFILMRALSKPVGRVLKHTPCAHCARQILFEHEADICAQCDAGLHARCIDEHRSKTHAAGPFR